jgi:predicted SnoaL-like aldol condensation-catalyzing enzyme
MNCRASRFTFLTSLTISVFVLASCNGTAIARQEKKMSSDQKQQVIELLKSIETGDKGPVDYINPNNYIQHNLAMSDGLTGFGATLQQLPKSSAKVNTVRVFQEGEYVFAHTEYDFFGPKIGFDIFRFENGKIVEHWDNLQQTPNSPNQSMRSMTDGPTTVRDIDKTQANKELVRQFVDDILVNGRMNKLAGYFDGDKYIQHNPQIGDGHRLLAEGNFVLAASEGSLSGQATSFYDLFRVEDGKIAEHWDTIETISPRSEWKNDNGKF